ncbi:MAG: hypothetical protein AAGB04_28610, partial [Pseudomonadota bacterium]
RCNPPGAQQQTTLAEYKPSRRPVIEHVASFLLQETPNYWLTKTGASTSIANRINFKTLVDLRHLITKTSI